MSDKGAQVEAGGGAPEDARTSLVEKRGLWPNRLAFYFVAVGSAVGFGNVWRFPSLCVKYGEGAFFIPYLLALFSSVSLSSCSRLDSGDQFFRTGDVGVFGGFHPRFRGVGVSSVACGFMLVCYYSMLIAWVLNAFFDTFKDGGDKAPWAKDGTTGEQAIAYFKEVIVGESTLGEDKLPTRVVKDNVGYSFMSWFIIWACIAFGVKWTGRVAYITMGLPIVLMFVFLGKSLTLEGHTDGIKEYIGKWNVDILREQGEVWSTAVSQIFFSIGVTFGIMTAYGSYVQENEPDFENSVVVAICNSLFSIISGFAVFASLGHLAYLEGKQVTDLEYGGFSLVFGTWPVVLGRLNGGIHWVRLLFFDLFLLGIDSAFSFVEGFVTVARDTHAFQNTPKWMLSGVICLVAWLINLMYATDAGLVWLDVIDFYINFTMLIVGFFESFAAGWIYGIREQFDKLGRAPVLMYMTANFLSVALGCAIWFGVDPDDGGIWGGFVALIGSYLIGIAATMMLLQQKMQADPAGTWTWSSIIYELTFKNVIDLKKRIEPVIGPYPAVWCFLIKQFIPHVLLILFVNLAQSRNEHGTQFGEFGGYKTKPFQIMGVLTFVFAAFLFTIGFIFPQVYEPLRLPEGHMGLDPEGAREAANEEAKDIYHSSSDEENTDLKDMPEKDTPEKPAEEQPADEDKPKDEE